MTREENLDPLMQKGSYAGAMGMPQFISSSFRNYAVDFDNDGQRNLWNNTADALGSVGNYFKRHGWVDGQPIAHKVEVNGIKYKQISPNAKPAQFASVFVSLIEGGIMLSKATGNTIHLSRNVDQIIHLVNTELRI